MASESEPSPIRFGTSGWRGRIAADFTFARLHRAIRGIAGWFLEHEPGEVLVGHDSRFLADVFARDAARLLAEAGITAVLVRDAVPTPAVTRAVRRKRAAGGIVITASHNPPEYAGVKVFGPGGVAIGDAAARDIEERIERASQAPPAEAPPSGKGGARVRRADLAGPYVNDLGRLLDAERIRAADILVVYDAMHGVGAGVFDLVLQDLGVRMELQRGVRDPAFGGGTPDPERARLGNLVDRLKRGRGKRLGIATDGDADRFAVVDGKGHLYSETESLALLVDHLARTGRIQKGVAISIATGSLVERVARDHGLAVERHPIGFKHLGRALQEGRADVAGEESGGFAWARFSLDKDGMLAGGLLLELLASSPGGLGRRLSELEQRLGASCCGRIAVDAGPDLEARLDQLHHAPPDAVGRDRVREIDLGDGLRMAFDDGFLLLRRSGTEPRVRVYAEASGPRRLSQRLAAGRRLLGFVGAARDSE